MEKGKRIDAIDAARGLAVVLMVIHHFLLDLVLLKGAPMWLFTNWVFTPLHYVFAGLFIFLSGVASRFSRNNLARGVKCLGVALLMTFVTSLPIIDDPIVFGVLHLLGVCMVLYGLFGEALDAIPRRVQPIIYALSVVVSVAAIYSINDIELIRFYRLLTPVEERLWGGAAKYLYVFGFPTVSFYSSDYFPLLPWLFVFLLGTWAGAYVKERRLPERFYDFTCPVLPAVGRRALIVYILHQPVLYALLSLL